MPHMQIHLALTDDWELRGNGSGDIEQIQFRAMRELIGVYESHGVKGTFNAEVMQQLTFRRLQDAHPQLKPLADAWDEHVRMAFTRGHDVQVHIHPQWSKVAFDNGRWILSGDWSLLNYEPEASFAMLSASKAYLEDLLRPLDPNYHCLSFRSGSSAIAPSPFVLGQLAELGLVFDMSIIQGMRVNTRNLQLDYTNCEEGFLPFYPRMDDARKVSTNIEPIVCLPIFSFDLSRRRCAAEVLAKIKAKTNSREKATDSYAAQEWDDVGRSSLPAKIYDSGPALPRRKTYRRGHRPARLPFPARDAQSHTKRRTPVETAGTLGRPYQSFKIHLRLFTHRSFSERGTKARRHQLCHAQHDRRTDPRR
jgi:hypothetical protein